MKRKAIALLSGGLDSCLAARLMMEEGVEVTGLTCLMPFLSGEGAAARTAKELGIPIVTVTLTDEYLDIVEHPRFGYGKNLNPCVDCKILMFRHARRVMEELSADFVVTGEVLGQRPKSQFRDQLIKIEKESGLSGLLLRPLSAKLLQETVPEKEGWVDRGHLQGIRGRTRQAQMELARKFGLQTFSAPAGGCLLTDAGYCRRLRDLMDRGPLAMSDVSLLKFGRHFRPAPGYRLVVGRNEEENRSLERLAEADDDLFHPLDGKGPTAIGRGAGDEVVRDTSARIVARYCSGDAVEVTICRRRMPGADEHCAATPRLPREEVDTYRI